MLREILAGGKSTPDIKVIDDLVDAIASTIGGMDRKKWDETEAYLVRLASQKPDVFLGRLNHLMITLKATKNNVFK